MLSENWLLLFAKFYLLIMAHKPQITYYTCDY